GGSWIAPCSRVGVGASSLMRSQLNGNEIDSQVLFAQNAVTTVHQLTHLCYHRGHSSGNPSSLA
ncbi:hypothetical protein, partial [Pseudomonas sp.]|uniref:hypothetical protein n=1 Tax=Pseudomonas sp. TaxID=306 RepID=UPI00289F5CA1